MSKVLIVDDDPDIREFIKYNLEKEDFNVDVAENGTIGLKKVHEFKPDLVLLDIMLPDVDGVETCMRIREIKNNVQPIVAFLTARSEDYSQIAGFDAGGDDYITKPIKPRLLVSRVKALLRRKSELVVEDQMIKIGNLILDYDRYLFINKDKEIQLPRKQFNILSLLISNAGKVVRRTDLMEKIWGSDVFVSDRNIDVQIRKIREKIGDKMIKTVKGVGYKFIVKDEAAKVGT
ncbi:MAG: response regulator transcription factor [Vicingaceae bacterium]